MICIQLVELTEESLYLIFFYSKAHYTELRVVCAASRGGLVRLRSDRSFRLNHNDFDEFFVNPEETVTRVVMEKVHLL